MPRTSKKIISKNLETYLGDSFISLVSLLKNPKDIKEFIQDFFTKEEGIMLSKRLILHIMLHNGYNTSQIQSALGMSRETIRIHKYIFEKSGAAHKKIIKLISDKQKTTELWKKIETIFKPLDLIMRSRTDMKARAKLASGNWFGN